MWISTHFVLCGELAWFTGDNIWWLLDRLSYETSEGKREKERFFDLLWQVIDLKALHPSLQKFCFSFFQSQTELEYYQFFCNYHCRQINYIIFPVILRFIVMGFLLLTSKSSIYLFLRYPWIPFVNMFIGFCIYIKSVISL